MLLSHVSDKLLREADDFLGQVVIDIRSITGNSDSWYELRPRTTKSIVQGSIRIKIIVLHKETGDDEEIAPLVQQYTFLHNSIVEYVQDGVSHTCTFIIVKSFHTLSHFFHTLYLSSIKMRWLCQLVQVAG